MAYYLVRAIPDQKKLDELRKRIDAGEIEVMRPFGTALDYSLRNARMENEAVAVWEEEDYCSPPLAMEREAVIDHYFTGLSVVKVSLGEGWAQIAELPSMWGEED